MIAGNSERAWALTARWVFPVDGPPLPGGVVVVRGERIVEVGPRGPADLDLGNAAVIPGLVNAHTHLDLTGLRGRCPPEPDFTAWLGQVIEHRRARRLEEVESEVRAGLAECLRYGTSLVGDISASGQSWAALAGGPLRSVVFRELLGLPADRARQAVQAARAWLRDKAPTPYCRAGLSPHAPYSVCASLLLDAAALAPDVPIAIHLAETQAELELLATRGGPFRSFLTALGVWDPAGLVASVAEVPRLLAGPGPRLFVHGNYLGPAEVPAGSAVVFCPRTHAAFGHAGHPFGELAARGVCVALGTDSLASSPDLSVLAEARFLRRRFPAASGELVLRMATLSGAEALGWADETGSLTGGKSADLVVLDLADSQPADPHELLFDFPVGQRNFLLRGRWLGGPQPARPRA